MSKFNLQLSGLSTDTDRSYLGDHDLFLTSNDKEVSDYCVNAIDNHDRLVEENNRLKSDLLFLSRSKQHSPVDSHYVLDSLVSMAKRTLSKLESNK